MLTTIKGIYDNGAITLEEMPATTKPMQVIVTFMDEPIIKSGKKPLKAGFGKGTFTYISPDFDEPLDDFKRLYVMKLLLDTHIYIWFSENNPELPSMLRIFIEEGANEKYISLVSFYEIAIKTKIGKLKMGKSIPAFINELKDYDITLLPISESHISFYDAVPWFETHRDPFDRLLIATALYENLTILTADKQFDNYTSLVKIIH